MPEHLSGKSVGIVIDRAQSGLNYSDRTETAAPIRPPRTPSWGGGGTGGLQGDIPRGVDRRFRKPNSPIASSTTPRLRAHRLHKVFP